MNVRDWLPQVDAKPDCSIFMKATDMLKDAMCVEALEKLGHAPAQHSCFPMLSNEELLSPGNRFRLLAWQQLAVQKGLGTMSDDQGDAASPAGRRFQLSEEMPCAIVALHQRAEWSGTVDTECLPTLVTHTRCRGIYEKGDFGPQRRRLWRWDGRCPASHRI